MSKKEDRTDALGHDGSTANKTDDTRNADHGQQLGSGHGADGSDDATGRDPKGRSAHADRHADRLSGRADAGTDSGDAGIDSGVASGVASGGVSGGQTTLSPPAKVKYYPGERVRVLASGLDKIDLTLDLTWESEAFFVLLAAEKAEAKLQDKARSLVISGSDGCEWVFNVLPFGIRGHEWLLDSGDVVLRIGNWLHPKSRPSMVVEISSEMLWRIGAECAVEAVLALVESLGARIEKVRASRLDVCADVLLPEHVWTKELFEHAVTRGRHKALYCDGDLLTGWQVGRGAFVGRLYDKPQEIIKSHKTWMFDIWGLSEVPLGWRIIRVEFQLRRPALKQLGIDSMKDALRKEGHLWAYCTEEWLKFQTRPGTHHTQRQTLPWWRVVQEGFRGAQPGCPLVRAKAVNITRKQLVCQALGLLRSLAALDLAERGALQSSEEERVAAFHDSLADIEDYARADQNLPDDIQRKMAQHHRARVKYDAAMDVRRSMRRRTGKGRAGGGRERSERPARREDVIGEVGPDGTGSASPRERGEREEGPSPRGSGIEEPPAFDAGQFDAGGLE
jgi:hypothetical protein